MSRQPTSKENIVGHYEIIKELGFSAMGNVYKARDVNKDCLVALKLLRPIDKDFVKRFNSDLSIAEEIRHPNIVRFLEGGKLDDFYYVATIFLHGENLESLVADKGKIGIDQSILVGLQIAEALEVAHSKGLLHRDIKPTNVFINDDNHITLVDFAIGSTRETSATTVEGFLLGTPEFMSPEQAQGKVATELSDIYSLGLILFYCLIGKSPYELQSDASVFDFHKNIPRVDQLDLNIPESLARVISKSLEYNCKERYQSATEVYKDLERILGQKH